MSGFAWTFPLTPYLLWCVPALAALAVYGIRGRARALRRFGSGAEPNRRALKSALLIGAFACAVISAAGPSWKAAAPVPAEGSDVIFLIDVSRSMLARDASPDRLGAARRLARGLMQQLMGPRIGIVAFAGSAQIVCPLTADYDFAAGALDGLSPESVDAGGTDLAAAIRTADNTAFDDLPRKSRVLLVLSDGETHGPDPGDAARECARSGVWVAAAGFGDSAAGAVVPGRGVWSKLDRVSLRRAAPGAYIDAANRDAADRLLQLIASNGAEVRFAYDREPGFQYPLLCGFVLLFANLLLPERRRPR